MPASLDVSGGVLSFAAAPGVNDYLTVGLVGNQITYHGGPSGNDVVVTVFAPDTLSLTAAPNPSTPPNTFVFTAALSQGSMATGTVTFTDTYQGVTTILGTATVSANGQAILTLAVALESGDHAITASYSGDANNAPISTTLDFVVSGP
jgi:hypothetical protein